MGTSGKKVSINPMPQKAGTLGEFRLVDQDSKPQKNSILDVRYSGMSSSIQFTKKSTGRTTTRNSAHALFQRNLQVADENNQSCGPKKLGAAFTVAFLDQIDEELKEEDHSFQARLRAWLAHVTLNQRFETSIGVLILSNFVVIALETDARARHNNAEKGSSLHDTTETLLHWITLTHLVYLCLYTLECAVRVYVLRWEFFNHKWNLFDFAIVALGVVSEVFSFIQLSSEGVDGLDRLRIIRTIRLLRATRILVSFDELYTLVSGLTHAMKALMWASLLMLMGLTVWSIIAVEYLKPLMAQVSLNNGFSSCSWCPTAFDNLLLSNLTFFQIISGDGWSAVGRPLIEEHPWTALVFIGVIFSMVFGLLNLIVAVIVDASVVARESDVMTMAAKKDAARAAAWDCFNDMVGELDVDGDGMVTVDELREGLFGNEELGTLGAYLTTMGIEMTDLDMVFELLDQDHDGTVTHEEFTNQLYQMKTQELPITLCYVRSGVLQLQRQLEKLSSDLHSRLDNMSSSPQPSRGSQRPSEPIDQANHDTSQPTGTFLNIVENLMNTQPEKSGGTGGMLKKSLFDVETPGKRCSFFVGKQAPTLRKATEKARGAHRDKSQASHDEKPRVSTQAVARSSAQAVQTGMEPVTTAGSLSTKRSSEEDVSDKKHSISVQNSCIATSSTSSQDGVSVLNFSSLLGLSLNREDEQVVSAKNKTVNEGASGKMASRWDGIFSEEEELDVPATKHGNSNVAVTSNDGASRKNLPILPCSSLNGAEDHVPPATTSWKLDTRLMSKECASGKNVSSSHEFSFDEEELLDVPATNDRNSNTAATGNLGAAGKNGAGLHRFSFNQEEGLMSATMTSNECSSVPAFSRLPGQAE